MKHTRSSPVGRDVPADATSEHQASSPTHNPLTYRFADLAELLRVSRRTLERERSAGRFPPPDLMIGKMPLWRPQTIRDWIEARGGSAR